MPDTIASTTVLGAEPPSVVQSFPRNPLQSEQFSARVVVRFAADLSLSVSTAGMSGLFTKQASDKLQEVIEDAFGTRTKVERADPRTPQQTDEARDHAEPDPSS